MVVFVDVNKREVQIYDENGIQKIPFHDVHILRDIIGNKKINYVTNVLETTTEEVVKLVQGISGQTVTSKTQRVISPDLETVREATYLHSSSKGTLLVSDINIKFDGFADCKAFDDNMKENIKKSPILRSLIKKGTVKIIGESQKNELISQWKKEMQKKIDQQSARDEALDNILMDGKVSDWDGRIQGGDIAIEIDVGRRGIGGSEDSHGASTMSELQAMIDGAM